MKTAYREVLGTVLRSEVRLGWNLYRAAIEYEYRVDGASYRGDKITIGPLLQFNWSGPARRLVKRYPVGSRVTVFIDPADAHRAYLQPRIDKGFIIFAIVFLTVVAFVLIGFLRGSGVL